MAKERWKEFVEDEQVQEDLRSDLIKAKAHSVDQPNFCPFGCKKHELTEHGYCVHLMGWTVPGTDRTFHPLKPVAGKVPAGMEPMMFSDGSDPQPVLPKDVLEKATVSSRVYRACGRTGDALSREPVKTHNLPDEEDDEEDDLDDLPSKAELATA